MTVTTRWWWVRHAPVINPDHTMYGRRDLPCDCSDTAQFKQLARNLPAAATWFISPLQRTRQTAEAILAADADGHLGQPDLQVHPELLEHNHGDWEGQRWTDFYQQRAAAGLPQNPFWACFADEVPPNGESFAQVCARVAAAIDDLTAQYMGQDIVMVGHGGVIRAAVGHALGLDPERALNLQILNLSLTRIDHRAEADAAKKLWRLIAMNRTYE